MSFILDALKKSENQRQRHIGPSLADVQVRRRESNRPWWVLAVAALLVINLGVLLAVLTRNNAASGNDRATAATLTPQPASAAAATPASADRSDAPRRAHEQLLPRPSWPVPRSALLRTRQARSMQSHRTCRRS